MLTMHDYAEIRARRTAYARALSRLTEFGQEFADDGETSDEVKARLKRMVQDYALDLDDARDCVGEAIDAVRFS